MHFLYPASVSPLGVVCNGAADQCDSIELALIEQIIYAAIHTPVLLSHLSHFIEVTRLPYPLQNKPLYNCEQPPQNWVSDPSVQPVFALRFAQSYDWPPATFCERCED